MDFSWAPYFGAFWIFPLLCFFFMVVMMVGCGRMLFGCGHGARRAHGEADRGHKWQR